jgi:hypothetical protein
MYHMKAKIKTREELPPMEPSIARRSCRSSSSCSRPPDKQERDKIIKPLRSAPSSPSSRCIRCSTSTNERSALKFKKIKSRLPMTYRKSKIKA